MKYKVITATNRNEFESKVNEFLDLGWQLQGSHQVMTNANGNFFSQTMVKGVLHIKDEVIHLLNTLKRDAEMALSGEWDCTTSEGIESFNDLVIHLFFDFVFGNVFFDQTIYPISVTSIFEIKNLFKRKTI